MNSKYHSLIAQNHIFHGMDFASIEYMLEHCAVRDLDAGDTLLQPEVPNRYLHLILEGELSVELVAQETLKHTLLSVGECAGEISLVDGKLPSALVIASKPTRILSVPHNTVWSLVDHSHEVARNLLTVIAGRMRNDNHALITSQNSKKQFEHQANVDALTGIHNRHWMAEVFPRALHRSALNQQPVSIMLVDIDHFKKVNDTYGHLVGDLALKCVANCMATHLRPNDLLVRYGGEEFAILLPNADVNAAKILANRLRCIVAETEIQNDDATLSATISIGIAQAGDEQPLDTLINEADRALYLAKKLGRNRVEVYS
jgi:diguanylate cyclase (GGDEF)-like protein